MKRIAFILPSLKNVGPNKVALSIINNLLIEGIIIKVFYFKNEVGLNFPCETEKLTWRNWKEIYTFDVLHSHMLRPDILNSLLPFYKGIKISTIHNMVEEDLYYSHGRLISTLVSKIWISLWHRFDHLAVLTPHAKNYYLAKGLPDFKINIIPNGIDKNKSQYISCQDKHIINKFRGSQKLLGTVCLANERKGLEQVIKGLTLLTDYCFILIGDGPVRDELYGLAHKLNVENRFLILGFRDNATSFLPYFDCFVLPSRSEGLSLALIEAISAKIPAVCSDIDVLTTAFNNDEVSFFKLDDIDSFKKAVLLSKKKNPDKAYQRYLSDYNAISMAQKYFKLYMKAKDI